MYTVPNFAGDSGRVGNEMLPAQPGGQNQWMNFPGMGTNNMGAGYGYGGGMSMPPAYGGPVRPSYPIPDASNQPGIVPPATPLPTGQQPGLTLPSTASKAGGFGLQGGAATGPAIDPALTNMWGQFLQQMMGTGVTPFNLSALLPSSGQATTPGTLTAPLTSTEQSLQDFFMGQSQGVSGVPGTSGPLSYVLPMWQSEVSAMNQPIQQQMANIKEQFGSQGALGSSEMAQALANYGQQTALGEQSLLGQLTMQALPQQMAFGQGMQGLDQQAIQNMYQEFIRTQPQYNPLIGDIQQMATSFPPIYTKQGGVGSALLGSAGGIMEGIAALASLCWLSRAVYGDDSWQARKIKSAWPSLFEKARIYRVIFALYVLFGEPLAKVVKRSELLKRMFRPALDRLLYVAMEA